LGNKTSTLAIENSQLFIANLGFLKQTKLLFINWFMPNLFVGEIVKIGFELLLYQLIGGYSIDFAVIEKTGVLSMADAKDKHLGRLSLFPFF
jgi:hypothetical protein